jgi:hypothetical protein
MNTLVEMMPFSMLINRVVESFLLIIHPQKISSQRGISNQTSSGIGKKRHQQHNSLTVA